MAETTPPTPNPSVSPQRVLITGATSGIGKACAIALATAGFNLLLVSRSPQKLAALSTQLAAHGVEIHSAAIDLAAVTEVKAQVSQAIAQSGPIDILINNAGMGYTGHLADMPLADWQQVMNLNLTSVFQVVQAALPVLRKRPGALILNIASIAAQTAFESWGAYGVSKAALVALSGAIAAEESAQGVRVVTLSPGAVDTALWDSKTVQADFDRTAMLRPETVAQTILHVLQLPPNALIPHLSLTPSQGAL
jgi:short-subunit dehydrogenase